MTRPEPGAILPIGLLAVSCALTGCRQGERVAWAADAQGLSLLGQRVGFPLEPTASQRSLALYLSGVLAERESNMSLARQRLEEARQYDPQSAQVLVHLGRIALQENDMQGAERHLRTAAELEGTDLRARFMLGVLYAGQERFDEAAEQYTRVLAQDPANWVVLSQLAGLYLLQDKLQEGVDVYQKLLEQRPDAPALHFTLGVLYAKGQQWPDAVRHLSRAVELDPGHLEARLGLAVSLEMAGELARAKGVFLEALQMEPANAQMIHYLAGISHRLGDLEEAALWIGRYLSFRPHESAAHLELASLRIEQGRWKEAVEAIQRAVQFSDPAEGGAEAWILLGAAYEMGREYEAAESAYLRAVEIGNGALGPALRLGTFYHRRGQYQRAERALQKAFEQGPDDPEVLNGLGYLYADWGVHLEEAVRLIERALAQDPENGAYLDSLGWAYFKAGRTEQARPLLEEAASRMPDSEILDHLGQVYSSLGRKGEAEEIWKRALSLKPQDPEITQRLKSHLRALQRNRKDRSL